MFTPTRTRPVPCIRRTSMRSISVLSLLLLLALGCAKWSHTSKGQREFNSDKAVCWREADASGETEYWARYRVHRACMLDRGWTAKDSWCCDREPSSP